MFLQGRGWLTKNNLKYTTTTKVEKTNKKVLMILDEIDAAMFENFEKFYDDTCKSNISVIGLTATPFQGNIGGIEEVIVQ